jgi:hypothetical protein
MAGRGYPKGPPPGHYGPPPPPPYYGEPGGPPPEYYPREAYPPPPPYHHDPRAHPHAPHPQQAGGPHTPPPPQVIRAGHDYCKGCRRCWEAVTKSLGASTWATAAAIAGPVIYLIATLIGASVYKGSPIIAYVEAVVSVIGGVTIFTGVVAFLALYCRAQTLLILCASLYRALGGWAFVSTLIIILGGWSWKLGDQSTVILTQLTFGISPPILVFAFCAAVMDRHAAKLMDDIAMAEEVLAGGGARQQGPAPV